MNKNISLQKASAGIAITAALSLVLLSGWMANERSLKIAPALESTLRHQPTASAIVVLKEQANLSDLSPELSKTEKGRIVYQRLTEVALRSQKGILTSLHQRNLKTTSHYIRNMIVVDNMNRSDLEFLRSRNDVERVLANPVIHLQLPKAEKLAREETGIEESLTTTGALKVWTEFNVKGKGIVIAGQDTGVSWDHPALKSQYRGWNGQSADHNFNWHDAIKSPLTSSSSSCGYNLQTPCDDSDHGTHTVGTVVGDDGNKNKIGMAPEAQWIACRNMDAGNGQPSTYIDCFEFLLAPYAYGGNALSDGNPALSPHVVNNSWGCPESEGCHGGEMLAVLGNMKAAGIMVVVSAGNDGPFCSTLGEPSQHSAVTLSVGAHKHSSGKIAYFSSRGPSLFDGGIGPDLTAPGVDIRSAVPGGGYDSMSGTSMAGPHVVGAVALLWSAQPTLIGKIDETVQMLTQTAVAATSNGENCGGVAGTETPNNTYGFGRLDIYAAVKKALAL